MTAEIGQNSRQVTGAFDSRSRGNLDVYAHLGGHDVGQGGLAQSGRSVKQQMVQRFIPAFGGGNSDVQIVLNPGLTGKICQTAWSQTGIERSILGAWFS